MRFDLLPVSRSVWRRKGRRFYIPTPGTNRRVGVCGAIRYPDGPFLFTFRAHRNMVTEQFVELLGLLADRVRQTGRRIILVLDNGSSFTSKRSREELDRLKDSIRVFWLPTYTSEQLNWIEPLWGRMKSDYFSRMLTQNPSDFVPAVIGFLKRLCRPDGIAMLLNRPTTTRTCRILARLA